MDLKIGITLISHSIALDSYKVCQIISENICEDAILVSFGNESYESFVDSLDENNYENKVIIFDSLRMALCILKKENLENLGKNNKVLLLFTLGTNKNLMEEFPDSSVLNAAFADYGTDINFSVHESQMTEMQTIAYFENDCSKKMSNVYFAMNSIFRFDDREDIFALLIHSEKFKSLVKHLVLNRSKRHFIYSRYRNRHGVKFLRDILTFYKFDVFSCLNPDDVKKFNEGNVFLPKVYLSDSYDENLLNISEVHILDNYVDKTVPILENIYKYNNYVLDGKPPKLIVNYYVCNSVKTSVNSPESIDCSLYNEETEKVILNLKLFEKISKLAKPIVILGNRLGISL